MKLINARSQRAELEITSHANLVTRLLRLLKKNKEKITTPNKIKEKKTQMIPNNNFDFTPDIDESSGSISERSITDKRTIINKVSTIQIKNNNIN